MLRTHASHELNAKLTGQKVTVAGWVDRRRDHGGLIFIDVRDRSGVVQVVFNPTLAPEVHQAAGDLRSEFVVQVTGVVSKRPSGTENPRLPTGEIEIPAESLIILNTSETPPFYINEDVAVDENLRLKYRYLDMRKPRVRDIMLLRHRVTHFMRNYFDELGFVEVETPVLGKSTPEGARDYLVPSRVHAGKFYALPQSPQQMKQLLMVGGLEKYYQIAKCFRDEDTRADRQPEFTQLDVEMSFIEEEDMIRLAEELLTRMTREMLPDKKFTTPFPRITCTEAMERYGSDKPDLRFDMHIGDVTEIVAQSEFGVFKNTAASGGRIKAIAMPGCGGYSRQELAGLTELAQTFGAKGLLPLALGEADSMDALGMEQIKSVAAKYLSIEQVRQMAQKTGAKPGDLLVFVADKNDVATSALGKLRQEMGLRLGLAAPDHFAFAWITDFPLMEWNAEMNRWHATHHPFTAPVDADIPLLDTTPDKAMSRAYDIVLNGYELGGGSIRIHRAWLQKKIFQVMSYGDAEITERFGHLLEAFSYGAPPHGGIALGLDRLVMLFAGADNIRETIPFPKNQNAADLLFGAPDTVSETQMKELHIELREE
ncbi:MAG: aspartate--tRNA ligase [Dehalococcoidia bacterium]|nr:aspartate--tRNA ligase [Dehalococcoidia bacterium]